MRWTYDGDSDSLYVYVSEEPVEGQRELADGTIADVAADGTLVGIEVLSLVAGWTPALVAREFGLPPQSQSLLTRLVHGIGVPSVDAVRPRTRLGGSAAPMPALLPA